MPKTLADWSSVLSAVLALIALFIALGVGTVTWQRFYLRQLRWRRIGKQLRSVGFELARRDFIRSTDQLLGRRIVYGRAGIVQEMSWLSELIGRVEDETIDNEYGRVSIPFTFNLNGPTAAERQEVLRTLAKAYRQYGAAVRRRWMLRTAAAPIVAEEYECSRVMADLIETYARLDVVHPSPETKHLQRMEIALDVASDGINQWVRLAAWPNFSVYRKSPCFAGVKVSYAPYRVLTSENSIACRTLPEGVKPLFVLKECAKEKPMDNDFDGIMTRLHGAAERYRIEMDPHSGRQQLHLCISETSYYAFRLTQWNESNREFLRPGNSYRSRLLSVNLLLVDDADRVILVRRASAITHGGQFAGAASGACEIVVREGIKADLDIHGVPDPMATVAREAREELGIDVDRPGRKLGAIGLIEVMSPRDMHTHVLTATARIDGSANDFRVEHSAADDIEGSWELGTDAMVIDLQIVLTSSVALHDFVAWLRAAPEMLPHAVGGLLLLVITRLELGGAYGYKPAATLSDLVSALEAPVSRVPLPCPPAVTIQPLMDR